MLLPPSDISKDHLNMDKRKYKQALGWQTWVAAARIRMAELALQGRCCPLLISVPLVKTLNCCLVRLASQGMGEYCP